MGIWLLSTDVVNEFPLNLTRTADGRHAGRIGGISESDAGHGHSQSAVHASDLGAETEDERPTCHSIFRDARLEAAEQIHVSVFAFWWWRQHRRKLKLKLNHLEWWCSKILKNPEVDVKNYKKNPEGHRQNLWKSAKNPILVPVSEKNTLDTNSRLI